MFTFISLWLKPYWGTVEYSVTLRYESGCGDPAVHLQKAGTIAVPEDSTPEEILLRLAQVLEQGARAAQHEARAIAP